METRKRTIAIVGAVIAAILQLAVVPAIAVGGIMPNILAMYAFALALLNRSSTCYVYSFACGIVSDLMGSGVVGGQALLLLIITFGIQYARDVVDFRNLATCLFTVVAAALLFELVYGIAFAGSQASIGELIFFRGLPCTLYDAIVGVIIFVIMRRVLGPDMSDVHGLHFR